MYDKIKILNLEDDNGDAELIKEIIASENATWEVMNVRTGEDFEKEFTRKNYDLILSDYKLPGYSGLKALEFVRAMSETKPFILVSGTMGEEFAVTTIKKGATDYVLKDTLFKLPSAIKRALKEEKILRDKISAENLLKESEEKYRNIIETALIGVYQTNRKGEITFANMTMANILGFENPDELKKHKAMEFYKDLNNRKKLLKILSDKGKVHTFETEIITINNNTKNVLMSVNFFGKTYTGMMLDITDRKRHIEGLKNAKEKAENLNKIKSNFLGIISHEMRTPMIGILGFSDILRKEILDSEQKELADVLYDSSKRLMNTLNLILDLSRVESNKQELQLSDFKISDTILSSIEVLKQSAINKNLYIKTNIENSDLIVNLDESLLIKIIHNLVDNAIKYTDKGGITIELKSQQQNNVEFAVIRIIDTGIGIDKMHQNIIFEEFRQVSEGLSRGYEGTGLGLTISKKYIELMGGKITVISFTENEDIHGSGSTFEIYFPIVKYTNLKTKVDENVIISSPDFLLEHDFNENLHKISKNLPKILHVEDDWASLLYVKKALSGIAELFQVKIAEEAIKLAESHNFDVILMDINIKGKMNGLELTEKFRNFTKYENTPIVAVTAFAMKGDKEEFFGRGCSHYLSKPFRRDELVNLIKTFVET